ncbi:MAG: LacI family DNA-binding transcriptional regulator [Victivallales bacterium]|nr:LacI family DNA-binding transcriptional regulator [Victivallales bacterium]
MSKPNVVLVARECGVSPSTVCRALNGKSDINEKTRERILESCRNLGYVRNSAARMLRKSLQESVACIVGDHHQELHQDKLFHLKRLISEAGFRWGIYPTDSGSAGNVFRDVLCTAPAGIITQFEPEGADLSAAVRNSVAVAGYDLYTSKFNSVSLDRETGVEQAIGHLLDTGRSRVMLLGDRVNGMRGRAYARTLGKRGIHLNPRLVLDAPFGRDLYSYGYECIRTLPKDLVFDAVLCINDACAIGAVRAFHERGISVPRDVAVVGFDNIMVSSYCVPSLTTVAQPVVEMAQTCVQLLLQRLSRPKSRVCSKVLDTKLVVRESTAVHSFR